MNVKSKDLKMEHKDDGSENQKNINDASSGSDSLESQNSFSSIQETTYEDSMETQKIEDVSILSSNIENMPLLVDLSLEYLNEMPMLVEYSHGNSGTDVSDCNADQSISKMRQSTITIRDCDLNESERPNNIKTRSLENIDKNKSNITRKRKSNDNSQDIENEGTTSTNGKNKNVKSVKKIRKFDENTKIEFLIDNQKLNTDNNLKKNLVNDSDIQILDVVTKQTFSQNSQNNSDKSNQEFQKFVSKIKNNQKIKLDYSNFQNNEIAMTKVENKDNEILINSKNGEINENSVDFKYKCLKLDGNIQSEVKSSQEINKELINNFEPVNNSENELIHKKITSNYICMDQENRKMTEYKVCDSLKLDMTEENNSEYLLYLGSNNNEIMNNKFDISISKTDFQSKFDTFVHRQVTLGIKKTKDEYKNDVLQSKKESINEDWKEEIHNPPHVSLDRSDKLEDLEPISRVIIEKKFTGDSNLCDLTESNHKTLIDSQFKSVDVKENKELYTNDFEKSQVNDNYKKLLNMNEKIYIHNNENKSSINISDNNLKTKDRKIIYDALKNSIFSQNENYEFSFVNKSSLNENKNLLTQEIKKNDLKNQNCENNHKNNVITSKSSEKIIDKKLSLNSQTSTKFGQIFEDIRENRHEINFDMNENDSNINFTTNKIYSSEEIYHAYDDKDGKINLSDSNISSNISEYILNEKSNDKSIKINRLSHHEVSVSRDKNYLNNLESNLKNENISDSIELKNGTILNQDQKINQENKISLNSSSISSIKTEKNFEKIDLLGNGELIKYLINKIDGSNKIKPKIGQIVYLNIETKYLNKFSQKEDEIEGDLINSQNKWVVIGERDVPPSVELCLQTMCLCEIALLKAPARLCYGSKDFRFYETLIYANSDLCFKIKLNKIINYTEMFKNNLNITEICSEKKNLGYAYFNSEDYDSASNCYRGALKCHEYVNDDIVTKNVLKNNLAMCYIKVKQFLSAIKLLEEVLAIEPENVKALLRMSKCQEELGRFKEAIEYALRVNNADSNTSNKKLVEQLKVKLQKQLTEFNNFSKRMIGTYDYGPVPEPVPEPPKEAKKSAWNFNRIIYFGIPIFLATGFLIAKYIKN